MKIKVHITRVLIGVGLLCLLIASIWSYRYVRRIYRRPPPIPRQSNVSLIQGWMTLRHLSRMYHIPEQELADLSRIEPTADRTLSLTKIAKKRGIPEADLIAELQKQISTYQSDHPIPSFRPEK